MDMQKLLVVKAQIEGILGNPQDPTYQEKYAAMLIILGSYVRLIALNPHEAWNTEQYQAALDLLVSAPAVKTKSRTVVSRQLGINVASRVPENEATKPQINELAIYAENLLNWSLYEERPVEEGLALAKGHAHIGAIARWNVLRTLALIGAWRLHELVPIMFADPGFKQARNDMWDLIYSMYADFATLYPKISHIEERLIEHKDWPVAKTPPAAGKRRIKVAVWSHKIGSYLSSMTTVHPWLMGVQDDELEVYILAERKHIGDVKQDQYRKICGERFIDCTGLSDDAFARMVTGHDFDVLMPLHKSRPALEPYRLARCHFDVLGWTSVKGLPDRALINESVADPDFLAATGRQFIVIPGPIHVYAGLPDVPLAERGPKPPFCFGSFSRAAKFNGRTFDAWAQIMRDCPDSIFFSASYGSDDMTRFVLAAEMGARGIDPARIVVEAGNLPSAEHLARYNRVDLTLDTFPIGAGVTAIDSFYMGVPLLAITGDTRLPPLAAKAYFTILGPEAGLNATSVEEYLNYAKKQCARGPRTLAERQKLRTIAVNSILFDSERYTRLMRKAIKLAAAPTDQQVVRVEL